MKIREPRSEEELRQQLKCWEGFTKRYKENLDKIRRRRERRARWSRRLTTAIQ